MEGANAICIDLVFKTLYNQLLYCSPTTDLGSSFKVKSKHLRVWLVLSPSWYEKAMAQCLRHAGIAQPDSSDVLLITSQGDTLQNASSDIATFCKAKLLRHRLLEHLLYRSVKDN
jgi:hypothetical protein